MIHRMPLWALWLLSPFLVFSQPPEDRLACAGAILGLTVLALAWRAGKRRFDDWYYHGLG